jgi:4-hydroxy-tetrahydrodipicolinate synthase
MPAELSGIVPPVVTPFSETGELRPEAFREEIRYHLDVGVSGIAVAGSTGEGNALSVAEHERVYEIAVEETDDEPVVAGVIATSTREGIEKAEIAAKAGTDFVMATPPHYNTPTDEGLIEYFRRLGEAAQLPLLIYDVIQHVDVTAALAERIADEVPELFGIKQSAGDTHGLTNMLDRVGDRLTIMSAVDDLIYPTYALGADGSIGGVTAIYPRVSIELWEAVQAGDHDRAREIHFATLPLARRAVWDYDVNYPAGVKEAIRGLGRAPGHTRGPMHRPGPDKRDSISDAVELMRARGAPERPET